MNPSYQEFKFPQIRAHPWSTILKSSTPPDCIDILSKLLVYVPTVRLKSIEVTQHSSPYHANVTHTHTQHTHTHTHTHTYTLTNTRTRTHTDILTVHTVHTHYVSTTVFLLRHVLIAFLTSCDIRTLRCRMALHCSRSCSNLRRKSYLSPPSC